MKIADVTAMLEMVVTPRSEHRAEQQLAGMIQTEETATVLDLSDPGSLLAGSFTWTAYILTQINGPMIYQSGELSSSSSGDMLKTQAPGGYLIPYSVKRCNLQSTLPNSLTSLRPGHMEGRLWAAHSH